MLDFAQLLDRLKEELRGPLPGRAAQAEFSPQLGFGRHYGPPAWDAKSAAVAVTLVQRSKSATIVLTRRPEHMRHHRGQVCFPGGCLETDETPEQGAEREWREELGGEAPLHAIGRLTPLYVFASNFLVTPCVFWCDDPSFSPNSAEVAEVVELPARGLTDPARRGQHQIRRGELRFTTPHLRHGEHRIWGATCMMLGELAQLLRRL